MNPVETHQGDSPIVLGLPHTGTYVPEGIMAESERPWARGLDDTDWHIHRLYDGVLRVPARSAPPSTATSLTPTATRLACPFIPAKTPLALCR